MYLRTHGSRTECDYLRLCRTSTLGKRDDGVNTRDLTRRLCPSVVLTSSEPWAYFQPARELRLERSELLYSLERGKLKIKCLATGVRARRLSCEERYEHSSRLDIMMF